MKGSRSTAGEGKLPRLAWLFSACLAVGAVQAQSEEPDADDLFSMDLAELLNVSINVSSNRGKSVREQPSIVSAVFADEIRASGARDLLDVLKRIPGVWVGVDAQGVFSLGLRGVWGIDGKVLLLIDGIEQNDLAFSTIVLNNRYSAETIKQVEIIRGPGTVAYGGAAELAVIKVTTVGAELAGQKVFLSTDLGRNSSHRNNLSLVSGAELNSELSYSFAAFAGAGDYSNARFRGILGNEFPLRGNSNTRPLNINLGLSYRGFKARFLYDNYRFEDRIGIGGIGRFLNDFFNPANDFTEFTRTGEVGFKSRALKLEHRWVSDRLEVGSQLSYTKQNPWYSFYPERGPHSSSEEVQRWRADVQLLYTLSERSNVVFGVSHYDEQMRLLDSYFLDPSTYFNGSDERQLSDSAAFVQYERDFDWLDITLGGRFERHGFAGSNFVPRMALNRVTDNYHAKLVYNQAFKIPQFGTVASAELVGNPIVGAEQLTAWEFEYGRRLGPEFYVQGNVYRLSIDDYIAYEPDQFANVTAGKVEVIGAELMLQAQANWGDVSASYSYSRLESRPLNAFAIDGQPNKVLGVPSHMLKFSWTRQIGRQASLNVSANVVGSRYACVDDPIGSVCGVPKKLDVEPDVSLYYRNRIGSWAFGLGLANLLNTDVHYVQPYRGGQAPTPGLGRRLMLDLEYAF